MNEEQIDFLEKLVLLEQEAIRISEDLPPGVTKSRAEHIAMVVRLLKARLEVAGPIIIPPRNAGTRS